MNESSYRFLKLQRRGAVLYLALNRPERLNAVTPEMSRELLDCLNELANDEASRVVVLTGEGRAFCAGGDLSLEDSFTGDGFRQELELYAKTVQAILSCPKPIVCEMNGDAVGWGATIALFCDIVIAARHARIGDPHVGVGLSTGDGASVIWPQLMGYPRARQFLYTGELMSAEAAATFGLISEAVERDGLRARVDAIADSICAKPALAVSMTKASINLPLLQMVRDNAGTYIEYELRTQQSPEHPQAVKAFMDRPRKPAGASTSALKDKQGETRMKGSRAQNGLWVEQAGDSGPLLLLIHGLGANGAVWDPFLAIAAARWKGRVLVPDLRGHGRSAHRSGYSFGSIANDLAELVEGEERVHVIGHSLGGAMAALLATGWFGVDVASVLALSVKTKWSQAEIDKGKEIANGTPRMFATRDEAMQRYVRVAGIATVGSSAARSAECGVAEKDSQFQLAADQKIFGCASLGVEAFMRATRVPLVLATGKDDPIAPAAEIRESGFACEVIDNAGHNVHMEAPEAVWELFARGTADAR